MESKKDNFYFYASKWSEKSERKYIYFFYKYLIFYLGSSAMHVLQSDRILFPQEIFFLVFFLFLV